MGERTRRLAWVVLVSASLYSVVSLAMAVAERWRDDPPPLGASRVEDPLGDVAPGGPAADAGRPPGIDLLVADVIRHDGILKFTATTADDGGERPRVWVVRLRNLDGRLLYMLYAGEVAPRGGLDVLLCKDDKMCSDRAKGATVETAPRSVQVRVPLDRLSKLPDTFEWEASVSSSRTANIDDTWNDFAPKAVLRPIPVR